MDIGQAIEFARTNHRGVLATRRADGRAQMSPIVHGVDENDRVMVSTREPAVKVRNIRRDPQVSLCVMNDAFFGAWAQIDGTAEIVSLPDAMPLLIDLYRQISGEHPDWDEYRQAMVDQRRVILRITATGAGPNVSG
jgi:PPOX class probable F420-dependent enzyme